MTAAASAIEARGALVLALRQSGLRNVDVLRAIETIEREIFLPFRLRDLAARNCPLPIGCGQTMEAPGALAAMLEALDLQPDHRVIEIGAGSGYGTAVLSRVVREVVAFERFNTLVLEARARLEQLGVTNAAIHCGDGLAYIAASGPFDRILVSACLTPPLDWVVGKLAPDGVLVCALPSAEGQGEELVAVRGKYSEVRRLGRIGLGRALGGAAAAL